MGIFDFITGSSKRARARRQARAAQAAAEAAAREAEEAWRRELREREERRSAFISQAQALQQDPYFAIAGPEEQARDVLNIRGQAREQGAGRGVLGGAGLSQFFVERAREAYQSELERQREDVRRQLATLIASPPQEVVVFGASPSAFLNLPRRPSPLPSVFAKFFGGGETLTLSRPQRRPRRLPTEEEGGNVSWAGY